MALLEAGTGAIDEAAPQLQELRVLRTRLNPLAPDDLHQFCAEVISAGAGPYVIASQNLHGVHTYLHDPDFAALHEDARTVVHIDGMPLVWLGRFKGYELTRDHRTACIDWIPELLDQGRTSRWRVFYLGSTDEVLDAGLDRIGRAYPGLEVEAHNGYFDAHPDSGESAAIRDKINAFRPDILLVGMGMGRQERWIRDNLDLVDARVIITTGAMMELVAGELPVPPRWLVPLGLEWLYRLVDDPRRTAHRYLVEPFLLLREIARRRPARA